MANAVLMCDMPDTVVARILQRRGVPAGDLTDGNGNLLGRTDLFAAGVAVPLAPIVNENTDTTLLVAADLDWVCNQFFSGTQGNRVQKARRLRDKMTPDDQRIPAGTPLTLKTELNDLTDVKVFEAFVDEIASAARILGVGDIWRSRYLPGPGVAAIQINTRAQRQFDVLLKAIKDACAQQIKTQIRQAVETGACVDEAHTVLTFLKDKNKILGTVQEDLDWNDYKKLKWKGSKLSLRSWATDVRTVLNRMVTRFPIGPVLELELRTKIIRRLTLRVMIQPN